MHIETPVDTFQVEEIGVVFHRGRAAEGGPVVPTLDRQSAPGPVGVFVDDAKLEPVGSKVPDVEELARVFGVGLVYPLIGEVNMLMGIDVVADLSPNVAIFVARRHREAVSGLIIAATAVSVAHPESPVITAAVDRLASVKLPAVGANGASSGKMHFRATGVTWRRFSNDINESKAGAVSQAVGSRDHNHVLNHARIDLAQHGIQVTASRQPIDSVGLSIHLPRLESANVGIQRNRRATLDLGALNGVGVGQQATQVGRTDGRGLLFGRPLGRRTGRRRESLGELGLAQARQRRERCPQPGRSFGGRLELRRRWLNRLNRLNRRDGLVCRYAKLTVDKVDHAFRIDRGFPSG